MSESSASPATLGEALTLARIVVQFHEPKTEYEPDVVLKIAQALLSCTPSETGEKPEPVPAHVIVQRHRRHVELSPGVGEDVQKYALAVCDDIINDLLPKVTLVAASYGHPYTTVEASAPSATRPRWIPVAEKPADDKFDGYYIGRDSQSGRPVGMTFTYPVDPDFYSRHMFDAVLLVLAGEPK